jgi:hypothetical protein
MFDFVMKMFSEGDATSRIRYGRNPKTTSYSIACRYFLYNTKVVDIRETAFYQHGAEIKSDIIILATEANELVSKLK